MAACPRIRSSRIKRPKVKGQEKVQAIGDGITTRVPALKTADVGLASGRHRLRHRWLIAADAVFVGDDDEGTLSDDPVPETMRTTRINIFVPGAQRRRWYWP